LNKFSKTGCFRLRILNMWLWGICLVLAFPVISAHAQDYSVLNGEWVRSDGDYSIRVSNAKAEGPIDAAYFNPNPHVCKLGWKKTTSTGALTAVTNDKRRERLNTQPG
jgi:hypothetical protein